MADSIRDALNSAIDNAKDQTPAEPVVVNDTAPAPGALGAPSSEEPAPASGSNDVKPADDRPAPSDPTPQSPSGTGAAPPSNEAAVPASWKPGAKAHWQAIPPEARAEIARREAETARALSHSAESRKFTQQFEQMVTPFAGMLEKHGVTPLAAVNDMFQWRNTLENGTDEQKVATLGSMIRNFKIDIAKLDDFLVQAPASQAPAPQFDPSSIPALQPLFAMAERVKQAEVAQVEQAVNEISSDPLFEELREDTADVLEWASSRGREMSVKQAFEQAKVLNGHAPSQGPISPSQAGAALAAAKKAAGAIAGAPRGSPSSTPSSLRDTISALVG